MKKLLKFLLISIQIIIGFAIWCYLLMVALGYIIPSGGLVERISGIEEFLYGLIFVLSYACILITIFKCKSNDEIIKRRLKISLIILLSFLAIFSRAGLTKMAVIPNRLDLEILCSKDGYINFEDGIEEYVGENCTCNLLDDSGLPTCKKCGCSCDDFISITEHGGNICDNCGGGDFNEMEDWKPIIYLYPTTETEVRVQLGNPERLSHTYPKYNSKEGRNVIAESNGDLVDLKSGRELYSLYREGISYNKPEITEGFVVKGEDTIPFLEEKLAILGLNEHEAEEFIVYRLPQIENNKRNLIRFETVEEINKNMPLNITPTPDSVIRVMMDWKALDEYVEILEQELLTPERTGFVVVERGGSKLG